MSLERILQVTVAALATLGAMLLGMGQQSQSPPLVVALAAILSVWLTDISGRFKIGKQTGNILMLLAALISFREVYPLRSELQTISLAWFLIYLQIILFFQQKTVHRYWLLIMIGLLQVAVATLFNQGVWFGLLLAVYMLLGFLALTLLLMHRCWEPVETGQPPSPKTPVQEPQEKSRWPLRNVAAEFSGQPAGNPDSALGVNLLSRLGRLGAHTFLFTAVMFFAVPRFGNVAWRGAVVRPQSLVGYADTVRLGELGQISESRDEVMQVRFKHYPDGAAQSVHGEIYLQGAALMQYDNGQWYAGNASWDIGYEPLQRERGRRLPLFGVVRQNIRISGFDQGDLFFISPYIPLEPNADITIDYSRQRLLRAMYRRSRYFDYSLGTTAIIDGVQSPLVPSMPSDVVRRVQSMSRAKLPNLAKLADQWIAESKLPKEDAYGRARYLEQQFLTSTRFRYSLTGQERDLSIDPIEDFIAKHPQGHCEYFATALTLMLRSQNIPARLISGYKCDEWNDMTGCYKVRQLHAHAWVEAYIRYDNIPKKLLHGGAYWPWQKEGAWLRLDPTPGNEEDRPAGIFVPLRNTVDWLDSAWEKYVVELDCQSQRDAIYKPIAEAITNAWRAVFNPDKWRAIFNAAAVALYLDRLRGEAAILAVVVASVVALAVVAALGWLIWRVARKLYCRITGKPLAGRRRRSAEIEFYRRLESLLARYGLTREIGQTQREFAASAGPRLAAITAQPQLAPLPLLVADAFYRVRFGRQPLSPADCHAVDQAISELSAPPIP